MNMILKLLHVLGSCSCKMTPSVRAPLHIIGMVLMMWVTFNICRCPDSVTIKKKMVYASTNETLKKSFSGIKYVECHDEDEFCYDYIVAKLKQADRA